MIDAALARAGWLVQDYRSMNLSAARGLAVREFPGANGPADYLLYADQKAIGIVEAKPEGHTLTGVDHATPTMGRPTQGCRCGS